MPSRAPATRCSPADERTRRLRASLPAPPAATTPHLPSMDHADHVALLRDGVPGPGGAWADLGAGRGAFTLALADLLGPDAVIHLVDQDAAALDAGAGAVGERFPAVSVETHLADFTRSLPFEPGGLDGIVMANALHFVRDKAPVLRTIAATIRPGGRFLIVEYGADRGNPWVPYPLSYPAWERLASSVGLRATRKIGEVPSRFLGTIYGAASDVPAAASVAQG